VKKEVGDGFVDMSDSHAATFERGLAMISQLEDDLNLEFMVGNPDETQGYVQYYVKGKDRLGEWEGQRRYNHFFFLHDILMQRWPGVYLPRLPPKKAIGRYE
jgi:hypothetical protein